MHDMMRVLGKKSNKYDKNHKHDQFKWIKKYIDGLVVVVGFKLIV